MKYWVPAMSFVVRTDWSPPATHESSSQAPGTWVKGPLQPSAEVYTAITVSSTVVAAPAEVQVEIVYGPVNEGVKVYQTLRDRSAGAFRQEGKLGGGGSPTVVAPVMSTVTGVR
jgi:hypothetical protein